MKENWLFDHIGIPVWDLDKAIAEYSALGAVCLGSEFLIDSTAVAEYLVYGETHRPPVRPRGVMVQLGSAILELLQPLEGHTVHREKLEASGEGVGHLAYRVKDLEAEIAALSRQGYPVILSITPKGQQQRDTAYIDTRHGISQLIIELIQAET